MMIVTQDTKTTFDLGGNPTEIKFYDSSGWAYTETRTYAKGYQITNATFSARAGLTATTSGSFTYDGNGNMLTSKGVTIYSGTTQFAYRANWTFFFKSARMPRSRLPNCRRQMAQKNPLPGRGRGWIAFGNLRSLIPDRQFQN